MKYIPVCVVVHMLEHHSNHCWVEYMTVLITWKVEILICLRCEHADEVMLTNINTQRKTVSIPKSASRLRDANSRLCEYTFRNAYKREETYTIKLKYSKHC